LRVARDEINIEVLVDIVPGDGTTITIVHLWLPELSAKVSTRNGVWMGNPRDRRHFIVQRSIWRARISPIIGDKPVRKGLRVRHDEAFNEYNSRRLRTPVAIFMSFLDIVFFTSTAELRCGS